MECPDENDLNDLLNAALPPDEIARVEEHLLECASCAELVVVLGRGGWSEPRPLATPSPRSPTSTPGPSWLVFPGNQVGRYQIEGMLGRGGMGVVYAARDPQLARRVALKVMQNPFGEGSDQERVAARMLREAQALAQLSHPNIVAVHDIGRIGENVFMAMDIVDGVTLRQWLHERRRSVGEVLHVFRQAVDGLAAVHATGLVHRDFKPDNLMVARDGTVRIVDFGLAYMLAEAVAEAHSEEVAAPSTSPLRRAVTDDDHLRKRLTHIGHQPGTPAYMAPELLSGSHADPLCDQFSFCLTLYEALHGVLPFPSESDERREAIAAGRMHRGSTRIPRWLRRALARGLALDPAARFPSMKALQKVLERGARATRRAVMAGGLVLTGIALAVLVARVPLAHSPCGDAAQRVAMVWSNEHREALQRAILETGAPEAGATAWEAIDDIDQYTHQWAAIYTEACEAALIRRERSPALFQRQLQCLRGRLDDVSVTVRRLLQIDRKSFDGIKASRLRLDVLSTCTVEHLVEGDRRPTYDEPTRARLAELRARLVNALSPTAEASHDAQRRLDEILDVADEARKLGQTALVADALARAAVQWLQLNKLEMAIYALSEALVLAQRAREAGLTITILLSLAHVIGDIQGRHEEGYRLTMVAEGQLEWQTDRQQQVKLLNTRGLIRLAQGRYAEALEHHRRALSICQELSPEAPSPLKAATLTYLGNALAESGQHEEALSVFERALAMRIGLFGPRHSRVAGVYNNIARSQFALGRREEAERAWHRALEIRTVTDGPDSVQMVPILENIAEARLAEGRLAEARRLYERAIANREAMMGPADARLGPPLVALGRIELRRSRPAQALPPLERALRILEASDGPPKHLVEARLTLAQALRVLRRSPERVAALEAAAADNPTPTSPGDRREHP